MELRHLQYFLTIAREGTISGAAQALHLSQPSLSRQMQDLERELDVKLFNRGSRHIELTEEGMRLRRRAEEIVDLVGRTEAELRVSAETIAGEVRIGSGETPAMDLVARVIAEMQNTYPLVRFALHSGNAEDVRERLEKGLIDFGLFIGQVDLARYETLALPACDRWGVFMRRDDPLCAREVLRVEDLVDMPLILSAQGNSELGPWFHRDAGELDIVATYNLLFNASLLVSEGVGIALCLEGIVNTSGDSDLVFVPFEPELRVGMSLVWKKNSVQGRAQRLFLDELREFFGT